MSAPKAVKPQNHGNGCADKKHCNDSGRTYPIWSNRECSRRLRQEFRDMANRMAREAKAAGFPLCSAEWKRIAGGAA